MKEIRRIYRSIIRKLGIKINHRKSFSELEKKAIILERDIQWLADNIKLSDIIKKGKKGKDGEREYLMNRLGEKSKEYRILTGRYFVTRYREED
ncbi:MAG: hypothetical protein AABX50_01870 [Nanoarchaeota archaeon]